MARTTPAQKPRGWASMTFINDLQAGAGLRRWAARAAAAPMLPVQYFGYNALTTKLATIL